MLTTGQTDLRKMNLIKYFQIIIIIKNIINYSSIAVSQYGNKSADLIVDSYLTGSASLVLVSLGKNSSWCHCNPCMLERVDLLGWRHHIHTLVELLI